MTLLVAIHLDVFGFLMVTPFLVAEPKFIINQNVRFPKAKTQFNEELEPVKESQPTIVTETMQDMNEAG